MHTIAFASCNAPHEAGQSMIILLLPGDSRPRLKEGTMNSPARIREHPIHPMLIVFPIGLSGFSLVCDIAYHAGSHSEFWNQAAFYSMAAGLIGALLAAIPGFMDYLSLTAPAAKRIATTHMVLNLAIVALYLFNLGIRYNASAGSELFGVVLSLVAIGILSVSGWLGGSLVYVHHVGVATKREDREIKREAA
jgi:uncharacterized membrane protein